MIIPLLVVVVFVAAVMSGWWPLALFLGLCLLGGILKSNGQL